MKSISFPFHFHSILPLLNVRSKLYKYISMYLFRLVSTNYEVDYSNLEGKPSNFVNWDTSCDSLTIHCHKGEAK